MSEVLERRRQSFRSVIPVVEILVLKHVVDEAYASDEVDNDCNESHGILPLLALNLLTNDGIGVNERREQTYSNYDT